MILRLTTMNMYNMTTSRSEGMTSNADEEKSFEAVDNLFRGATTSTLIKNIVVSYMHLFTIQGMWRDKIWDLR